MKIAKIVLLLLLLCTQRVMTVLLFVNYTCNSWWLWSLVLNIV